MDDTTSTADDNDYTWTALRPQQLTMTSRVRITVIDNKNVDNIISRLKRSQTSIKFN